MPIPLLLAGAGRAVATRAAAQVAARGGAKVLAQGALRQAGKTMLEGGARRASIGQGTNWNPRRGFTTVPVPGRTAAQAAVWGQTGQVGSTQLSGFGQLDLDRGFRGVRHSSPGYNKMMGDDEGEVTAPDAPLPRSKVFFDSTTASPRPVAPAVPSPGFSTVGGPRGAAFASGVPQQMALPFEVPSLATAAAVGGRALDRVDSALNSRTARTVGKVMPSVRVARSVTGAAQKARRAATPPPTTLF